MDDRRRAVLLPLLLWAGLPALAQDPLQQDPDHQLPSPKIDGEHDTKLPNGKSQKDAIAKDEHERALKDADDLIAMAQQLKDELQKTGNFVVSMSSVKKTEEIEKLARRIRSRLKA